MTSLTYLLNTSHRSAPGLAEHLPGDGLVMDLRWRLEVNE